MTEVKQDIIPPTVGAPGQLDLFADALEVERERIRSQDRRTDVVRAAIEANDASDKRQFEFQMAKLAEETSHRQEKSEIERKRLTLAVGIASFLAVLTAFISFIVFYMMFFGDERQSQLASDFMSVVGTGIGGFGLVYAAIAAFRALVGRR